MKKKNRLYRIRALFLVMSLALFLTPAAFAADDLDDLPPLIPSDMDPDHPDNLPPLIPSDYFDDIDDLPPLVPSDPPPMPPVPPGKDPPTEPPIEIEVPDDGEDLDLKLSEEDIQKIIEGSEWTITINGTWSGTYLQHPDAQNTFILSFVADKAGGADMFGTYKARAAQISRTDYEPVQAHLEESENFTIELTAHHAEPVDEDDDLGPLLTPVAEFIGKMPILVTVLADPHNISYMNPTNWNEEIRIFVNVDGSVRLHFPEREFANGTPMFVGRLSRNIDGRGLS